MTSPIRQVIIPTNKVEETKRFYSDILGLQVYYDQVIVPDPETEPLLGSGGTSPHRLVVLQQGDSMVGMLGLVDYMQSGLEIESFRNRPGMPYPVHFIFIVYDVNDIASKVSGSGYTIVGDPRRWEIPGRGIAVGMSFEDPNGVLIELTRLPQQELQQCGPISPMRRVTIPIVRGKMEEYVRFYQLVLDMSIYVDLVVEQDSMTGIPGMVKSRVVSLMQGDIRFGMVGLVEYLDPELQVEPLIKHLGYPYQLMYIFVVDNLDEKLAQAQTLGSAILSRKTCNMPKRGEADTAMISGPGGVVIKLIKWLSSY